MKDAPDILLSKLPSYLHQFEFVPGIYKAIFPHTPDIHPSKICLEINDISPCRQLALASCRANHLGLSLTH